MAMIKEYPVQRYIRGAVEEDTDPVLSECSLELYVDGIYTETVSCIPEYLEEMALGKLYTEGRIFSIGQVRELTVNRISGRADVSLLGRESQEHAQAGAERPAWGNAQAGAERPAWGSAPAGAERPARGSAQAGAERPARGNAQAGAEKPACDSAPARMEHRTVPGDRLRPAPFPDQQICPEEILMMADRLLSASEIFRKTGNAHSAMLCRGSASLCLCEDVDRYRAFEKAVGRALKDGVDFSRTVIYTTGRVPRAIAEKAIRAGIPVIVSRSAPTDQTLKLAAEYNLTVIGFARGDRMNIYHKPV